MHPKKADLPILVDGKRLDTMATGIETLTGVRSVPKPRDSSVTVPGLHGVVPSMYDDLEPGTIDLRGWVSDTQEDGSDYDVADPVMGLHENLDRLLQLFGPRHDLIDVRLSVGPELESQWNVIRNPRADSSSANGTWWTLRTNALSNPSFASFDNEYQTVRENLIPNPRFDTPSLTGWTITDGTLSHNPDVGAEYAGSLMATQAAGPGNFMAIHYISSLPTGGPDLTGIYTWSMQVSNFKTTEQTLQLSIEWLNSLGNVITTEYGQFEDLRASWLSLNPRVQFRQLYLTSEAPAGAKNYRLRVNALGSWDAGDVLYIDDVMMERAPGIRPFIIGKQEYRLPTDWRASDGIILQPDYTRANAWSGTTHLQVYRQDDTADIPFEAGTSVLRSLSPADESLSPTGRWSASLRVRSDAEPSTANLALRIVGYDDEGDAIGYGSFSEPDGPPAETRFVPSRLWTEIRLVDVHVPTGTETVGVEVIAADGNWSAAEPVSFDSMMLENNPALGPYFDGETSGQEYTWLGAAHQSASIQRARAVAWWHPNNGSFICATSNEPLPIPNAVLFGEYQVDTPGSNFVTSGPWNVFVPDHTWSAGTWVRGVVGVGAARLTIAAKNAADVELDSRTSGWQDISSGWTWVTLDELWQSPWNTVKVELRVEFAADTDGTELQSNDIAWLSGSNLSTADGPSGIAHEYFDETTPGCTLDGDIVKRLPDQRQALAKVEDAIVPEVFGAGRYAAKWSVSLMIPEVFWRDPIDLVWAASGTPSGIWYGELTNLRGGNAPIEDAIVMVYGNNQSNPVLRDPVTGSWIRLNRKLITGQVWMIDCANWRSAIGSVNLKPESPNWSNMLQYTDYTGPRNRLFMLSPRWSDDKTEYVYQLGVENAETVKVIARRKWL